MNRSSTGEFACGPWTAITRTGHRPEFLHRPRDAPTTQQTRRVKDQFRWSSSRYGGRNRPGRAG